MSRLSRLLGSIALEGNIRFLAAQTIFSQAGFGMLAVVWQPYILSTGFTVPELGVVQSFISLATAAGLFLWGPLSDRFGRKPVMLVGHLSRVAAAVALIVSGQPAFIYAFALFIGFSALWYQSNPARVALLSESVGNERRATAYSSLLAVNQLVNMVAASAGGYIAAVAGYWQIFAVCIIGELVGVVIIVFKVRETREAVDDGEPLLSPDRLRRSLLPEKDLRGLYLMMAVMGVSYGIGYAVWYGSMVAALGFSTIELGVLTTTNALAWAVASIPMGKLAERLGSERMIMGSCAASLITTAGFILSRSFPLVFLFNIVNAFDPCLWVPNWVSYIAGRVPAARRSTVLGKLDAYNRLAGIAAPTVGGLIYASYGYAGPFIAHFVLSLIWVGLLVKAFRRT